MTVALANNQVTIWWVTLGLGLTVAIVVVILLSLLTGLVRDIDHNVDDVWQTATRVARNTTTVWILGQTAGLSEVLRDEVAKHAALFESKKRRR